MIPYEVPDSGELERNLWQGANRLELGELVRLGLAHGFERNTLSGIVLEDTRIDRAEQEAGEYDPDYLMLSGFSSEAAHKHALTREEWEASPLYREGIAYAPNMTPTRARILAEALDRRTHEREMLSQNADTLGRKAALFGAGMLASLPDPVNFIPVAASLAKGASLGRTILHGAKSGALSTAVADAAIVPEADRRGEDLGFYDAAVDTVFGAVLGGGLSAAGYGFARFFKKNAASYQSPGGSPGYPSPEGAYLSGSDSGAHENAASPFGASQTPPGARQMNAPASLEPQSGEQTLSVSGESVNGMQAPFKEHGSHRPPEAGAAAPLSDGAASGDQAAVAALSWDSSDMDAATERGQDAMARLRGELFGPDRVNAGRLVDAVLRDIGDDAPLDVMGSARRMGMEGPPYIPDGLPVVHVGSLVSETVPLWRADLDAGELFGLAEKFWMDRHGRKDAAGNPLRTTVATAHGDVVITGKGGWRKYRNAFSPEKLRMVPFIEDILRTAHWGAPEAPRRQGHQKQGMKIHPLRAAVEMDGRMYDVALTVREDGNGKLFYDLGAIAFDDKKPGKPSAHPDATAIHRGNDSDETRRSLASGQEGTSAGSDIIDGASIADAAEGVNLEILEVTPDWTPEPRQRRAAPVTPEERSIMDRAMDYEAQRLAREGGATPEEAAALEGAAVDVERVKREEEAMLSVLECVVGALE